jgi:hypothetical protein
MDGLKLSMEIVIALISGVISAAGVWFKLKGSVELQQLKIDTMEEDVKTAQSRITSLKKTVEHNREKNENSVADLKKEMGDMEMRIIKAIHELTTEINKK